MTATLVQRRLEAIVATSSGVEDGYVHGPKIATAGEPIERADAVFKWYALHALDRTIPENITALARDRLRAGSVEPSGLGFAVLHRCGAEFYFLLVCTWRNSNELWESVFYKDGDAMTTFEEFPRSAKFIPTFCVWELAAVVHEKRAWERFLTSRRDADAALAWLADTYSGPA